ncbi:hypothetical protein CFOL_v3_17494 [Cephalotus follicularis]|uniref:DUF4378 domain-containing protein n=1 Tax=Cephalotus follicularis TaxID=3775 RepID=A0A1Q3C1I4_CEPFO|nr:hypothetical protein CFOL_v3_17494 [Cephalotus follicularis]
MMAQKQLLEFLQEDQEPFVLQNYIADRLCQLKRPSPKTHLQVNKRKPISQNSIFPSSFCKNACLFSFHGSPDPRKSPLFEFQSPVKSPCKSPNAIFLQIPARTAALLLEAALKIQKQSSKNKTQNKNQGFGLFGSLFKRLSHRNKTMNREICGDGIKVSVRDILRSDSSVGRQKPYNEKNEHEQEFIWAMEKKNAYETGACEMGFYCSCNGKPSTAVLSESEKKSLGLDLEASCSGQSEDFEELELVSKDREVIDFASCDNRFCDSPFRFVLQRSLFSGRRTPEFLSPPTTPGRHKPEDNINNEVDGLKKLQLEEEEEEKEQCSPVSVLDPPFEDDHDGHEDEDEDEDEEEDGVFDIERSYSIVQKAKQQLLHKLCRFEKLAGLDPVELEKMMSEQEQEQEDDDCQNCDLEEGEVVEEEEPILRGEKNVNQFVKVIFSKSSFHNLSRIPGGMKRLVSDLIAEEEKERNFLLDDDQMLMERVGKRLESWKEVESNTIDMMVEQDFRKLDGWKQNQEQLKEIAMEIELTIFGLLVEELSEELICLIGFSWGKF